VDEESALWIVVGLGNPGSTYQGNRHNVGFMVADRLAEGSSLQWQRSERFAAELCRGRLARAEVLLVKPQTYMNLSGRSVAPLAQFYDVPIGQIAVVHDDVDLELGRLKVKAGGGDGGHKGLRSLGQELGSPEFVRIRVGVGRPVQGDVTDHVLQDFSAEEQAPVADQVGRAADAVIAILTRGLRSAMNTYNVRPSRPDEEEHEEGEPTKEQAGTTQ